MSLTCTLLNILDKITMFQVTGGKPGISEYLYFGFMIGYQIIQIQAWDLDRMEYGWGFLI